jgi:hypothetical protein
MAPLVVASQEAGSFSRAVSVSHLTILIANRSNDHSTQKGSSFSIQASF